MIELSVSLASNGVVKVPGYEQLVRFGYTKNRGVYRLAVTASGEWEGLTIRCFWHVPDGKDPASTLVKDGYVAVPASVTAQPGNGCVTFEGSDGSRTVTSADLRYRVSANSGTDDGSMPEPGTPAWQQLVDAVHTDATAAEQAKTDAQTAAQQAGASAKKAGQALSDTITAKEDALKAIGDKQTAATQAVDTARDKALQQVEASTEAAQTAAGEAATSAGNADQSAQAAAGSLQELKNGIASGNFKGEPGTSPTVTVQDIADGHRIVITDATGTSSIDVLNGKDGAPGKDATVDATLSQSGKAADAKVTGDALATKAVIDDTAVGADAWSSKHIIDTLCPPISETGNSVVCYPVVEYPLGVVASWEPTQEGSGEPSPDNVRPIKGRDSVTVTRCGENLLNVSSVINEIVGNPTVEIDNGWVTVDGELQGGNLWLSKGFVLRPGTYCAYLFGGDNMQNNNVVWLYGDGDVQVMLTPKRRQAILTVNNTSKIDVYLHVENAFTLTQKFAVAIVPGTTAPTTYSPYTGQTATLSLPRTIYGGEVDAVRGEGQETWKIIDLANAEISLFGINQHGIANFSLQTEFNNIHTVPGKTDYLTSSLPQDTAVFNDATKIGIMKANDSTFYIRLKETDANNEVTAKAYLASINAKLAYKLATPTPFTATGAQPISALSGVNTVLTDADSATVTGRADPIKRITDLEDAVASMTNT